MKAALVPFVAWALVAAGEIPAAPAGSMSFFVAGSGLDGGSANLGGLEGADAHCRSLAEAAGAGGHTWRAYLSTAGDDSAAAVDARDRIGHGPWYNARGVMIARDLGDLHSDLNRIDRHTALNERGELPKSHDILTGSDAAGRLAIVDGVAATCGDWTRNGDGVAMIGHNDVLDADSFGNKRFDRWQGSWNAEHPTLGCDAKRLAQTGGGGLFYCFAADAVDPAPPLATDRGRYTFRRGLNVNHWIGDNLDPSLLPDSLYGDPWFDGEDVAWIARQGFDHLRLHVAGHEWIAKNGDLDAGKLAHFDNALAWAKANGIGVVLNMTSLPGFRAGIRGGAPATDVSSPFTDATTRGDAAYLWWQVARRYAREGDALRFEVLHAAAPDAAAVRVFNRAMLAAIRRTNPTRIVYLTGHDARIDSFADVEWSDPHTALSVDFWEPELFTFQHDARIPPITFPGKVPELAPLLEADDPNLAQSGRELDVAMLDARIAGFAERVASIAKRHEVYIGSWGVLQRADDDSARRYVRAARAAFERHGFAWALYDYHSGCAVRAADGGPTRILDGLALARAAAATGADGP
jgi:endoglucanase